ncbi:MAG: guanosine-3',5'-bis(diphosphate) 3'-pyrophosphohydrolase [Desulforhopalus sp.]|jgi:guanosine-3',5'-bis(diphosphate) 3'-pyrophosphohydrolase
MHRIPFDLELYRNQMQELIGDKDNVEVFWAALDFAVDAHDDQWRRSGDAYILHPCSVAKILAEEMDITHPEILSAALLHDTVEDVEEVTVELVERDFGAYVRAIVEGCTKVTHVSGDKQANSRKTHRKIFTGAALRPEVMLVKLADRLHNLRTLQAMPKDKRQRIADETLDIYAPLATFFGLFNMKREMYNLALLYKYPKQGARVNSHIRQLRKSPLGQKIVDALEANAEHHNFPCRITIRTKKLWAYFDVSSRILVKQIDTPLEILIVVDDIFACYRALGIVNQTFKPIPRTIRDFIANPKPTGYQGLHARPIIEGQKFLFKIRTTEMERKAQRGLFRGWTSKISKQARFFKEIQEMFDVIGSEDSVSYRDVIAASSIKEMYTYTPDGDLVSLPVHSTVLDFAFRVHTQVGLTCLGAMIRNKRVPSSHVLTDGVMVRIIRSEEPVRFEQEILAKCKTARARGELAKTFKARRMSVTKEIGASMLRQEMLRYGIAFHLLESEKAQQLFEEYSTDSLTGLHIRIGEGRARLKEVMGSIKTVFLGGESPLVTPTGAFNNIELTTLDPVSVKLSSCCKPNPTSKGNCALLTSKGLSVHDKRCERFKNIKFQREDAVNVFWRTRKTNVRKRQIIHILKASRREIIRAVGFAPEEMQMQSLELLSSYSSLYPAWELNFTVPNLYVLQKLLKHFDKTHIPYEFDLDC